MSNIYQAMAEVMKDVEAIKKDQKNQSQGFKFRGIDDVYNAVHPIFAKHGVFTVPTVLAERTEERQTRNGGNLIYRILTMKYTFFASDGSSVEAVVIGEGMDSGDKGANKGMAIAHKYALLQTLCIPTEDMIDPDSEVQPASTRKPENNAVTGTQKPDHSSQRAPEQERQKFDPASASVGEVAAMTKSIMTNAKPMVKGIFTIKRAWNQILEICSGDTEFAKGIFAHYGADSSDKITYEIYLKVFNEISIPQGEQGPESFNDDEIPFGDIA